MREASDIQPKWVAYFLTSLAVGGLIVFIGCWLLFRGLSKTFAPAKSVRSQVQPENVLPPEPRLEVDPEADNREYIRRQSQVLLEYGWVDPQKGIAHIPIDRAMELLLERGVK